MFRIEDNLKVVACNQVLLTGYILVSNNLLQFSNQTKEPYCVFKIGVFRKVPKSKLGTNTIALDIFECIVVGDEAKTFNANNHVGTIVNIKGNLRAQAFKLKDGTQSMHFVIYCYEIDIIGTANKKLIKYLNENKNIRQLKFLMRDDAYEFYRDSEKLITVALDEDEAYLLM